MANQAPVKTEKDPDVTVLEEALIQQIADLEFLVKGLEHYAPFKKAIEMWATTRDRIDETWHLLNPDSDKFRELRVTKYAVNTLIEFIPNLKQDLRKCQEDLVKLQNPDEFVHRDYDER